MQIKIYTIMAAIAVSTSCINNDKDSSGIVTFDYGVASGDPGSDGVLLWTRAQGSDTSKTIQLEWEVSRDSLFGRVERSGRVQASANRDFCAKVWVDSLSPGTSYYYRFKGGNHFSPVGRTNTLPNATDTVRLAIVNCGKYEGGFFNVYDAVSKMEGLNAVMHLGDYIYEDGGGQKAYQPVIRRTSRRHDPPHELVTLEDYRTRYRQYRADTMLQRLHRRYPMINIWDDHEFANNAWSGGVNGRVGDKPGGWNEENWKIRVANAIKAYDEWIPIKTPSGEPIYRSFKFADLVNLVMLDTRMCCRTQQASSETEMNYIAASSSLLGDTQLNWLEASILGTNTTWNLIGNQVLVARRYLGKDNNYISLDQWTGYPKDRERFLNFIAEHPRENVIITTGNVHDAFHFELRAAEDERSGRLIAHEFAPGSVSSGNSALKKTGTKMRRDSLDLAQKNPHLKWFNLVDHSFIVMNFTANETRVDFYQVDTIYTTTYTLKKAYSYYVNPR